ncbi:MAG: glycosyltransferase family 2 protein [Planctomycetaceae bacterium]
MYVIVQVPCYNESQCLPATLAAIPREFPGVDRVEILVIDDGSTDGTSDVAADHGAHHVMQHQRNRGLAAAFLTGIQFCVRQGADIVINTDADGQYAGEDIGKLVDVLVRQEADLVIGNRRPWLNREFSLVKRGLQWFGSKVVSFCLKLDVPDAVSGFRGLTNEVARDLVLVGKFSHTIETLARASANGFRVTSIPIRTNPTTRPSRLFRGIPQFLRRSSHALLRSCLLYWPMRVFGTCTIVCWIIGGLPILRFLILWSMGQGAGHIQSLILGGVLMLFGAGFAGLGFLGELLAGHRKFLEELLVRQRQHDWKQAIHDPESEENSCAGTTYIESYRGRPPRNPPVLVREAHQESEPAIPVMDRASGLLKDSPLHVDAERGEP